MKIYTKTGDAGETSLIGGTRVKKNCLEIDAIGELDELNAAIGVLVSMINSKELLSVQELLTHIQHRLFTVGSNLADVQMHLGHIPRLREDDIGVLEAQIDDMERDLHPLTQFILPGGEIVVAQAFLARAICRRAERRVVDVAEKYPSLDPLIKQYLNRLSDLLFVLARWLNMKAGKEDVVWKK